jgi:hypothetical protein
LIVSILNNRENSRKDNRHRYGQVLKNFRMNV